MTATTEPTVRCNRCRRVLRRPPIYGYGPACARRYGLTPQRRARVRQPVRAGGGVDVLAGLDDLLVDETEINESGDQ